MTIFPVMLAGGSGTRLWPLSRKSYPKQFSKLISTQSLFQQCASRLLSTESIQFAPHITITNSEYKFIVSEQLLEIDIDPGPILIEPEAKNTAAAILSASLFAVSKDPDAILLAAPADHLIAVNSDFHSAIMVGLKYAQNGSIVTFGINPSRPDTGYGYLELSKTNLDEHGTSEILKFVEKPIKLDAQRMYEAGNFLWNAGIFLFKATDMIEAFKIYDPQTLELTRGAIESATHDLGFLRLAAEPWSKIQAISIDYAIMEKTKNLLAVPYHSEWSDVGTWDAVWSASIHDELGNVTSSSAHAIECSNSLLRSESVGQRIVGIGLDNIIAIAMSDAVLVAHKNSSQKVKNAVNLLKSQKAPQAEIFPKNHRPWGYFESVAIGERFQVKRIVVKPNAALSLQSHSQRSEHWVVVAGLAKVTIDGEIKLIKEGESVYIPIGAKHRLENKKRDILILIEVQIGFYLGEDDIVRYEDNYART